MIDVTGNTQADQHQKVLINKIINVIAKQTMKNRVARPVQLLNESHCYKRSTGLAPADSCKRLMSSFSLYLVYKRALKESESRKLAVVMLKNVSFTPETEANFKIQLKSMEPWSVSERV